MYVCTIKQYVLSFTQAGYGQALFDTLAHRAEFFSCTITLHGCGNVHKIFNAVSFPLPKECTILPLLSYAGIKPLKPQWLAYQEHRFPSLLPVEQSTFCWMHLLDS